MNDYFCQWCYDRGLRYPDDGKPWAHALDCPHRRGVDNTPHPSSCACAECRKARVNDAIAVKALKAAYHRGHYCDMGEKCPGCMAGYALEAITGRKWTQEECEEPEVPGSSRGADDASESHGKQASTEIPEKREWVWWSWMPTTKRWLRSCWEAPTRAQVEDLRKYLSGYRNMLVEEVTGFRIHLIEPPIDAGSASASTAAECAAKLKPEGQGTNAESEARK